MSRIASCANACRMAPSMPGGTGELTETVTVAGEERTFSIAGFYRLRAGLIASAKIYREGSAEIT
jgi:hypothetical protein